MSNIKNLETCPGNIIKQSLNFIFTNCIILQVQIYFILWEHEKLMTSLYRTHLLLGTEYLQSTHKPDDFVHFHTIHICQMELQSLVHSYIDRLILVFLLQIVHSRKTNKCSSTNLFQPMGIRKINDVVVQNSSSLWNRIFAINSQTRRLCSLVYDTYVKRNCNPWYTLT